MPAYSTEDEHFDPVNQAASDSQSRTKQLWLVSLLMTSILLGFMTINTTAFQTSLIYLVLSILAPVAIMVAWFFKKTRFSEEDLDIPVSEPRGLLPVPKKYVYMFSLLLFFMTLLALAVAPPGQIIPSAVLAPSFEVADFGPGQTALLILLAQNTENFVLIAVLFGIGFFIGRVVFKNSIAAFGTSLLLMVALGFSYHLGVYGFNDQVSSIMVIAFWAESWLWLVLFRDIAPIFARHAGNNLGIWLWKSFTPFGLLVSLLPYVIISAAGIAVVLYLRSRRGRGGGP